MTRLASDVPLPSIQEALRSRKLEVQKVVPVMLDIVRAAIYMHSRGWVHGDLKSSNIMLQEESWTCRLVDFGHSSRAGEELRVGNWLAD